MTTDLNVPAALRREHLKHTHLSRRDSEIRRAERAALAEHIAEIQAEVPDTVAPTGSGLQIAERYRR